MKLNLIVGYAGQTRTFTNIEFDDEVMVSELTPEGVDAIAEIILNNFMENFSLEVEPAIKIKRREKDEKRESETGRSDSADNC